MTTPASEYRSKSIAPAPWPAIWALCVTEIISWGTLYYAISVLIAPIEEELGWTRDAIVGAFSVSVLFAGIGALPIGILIDRLGGRAVMAGGSFGSAALFLLLSQTQSIQAFYVIWAGLGLMMAMVLYEPAFAVITARFGSDARKGITILTLAGGLASTVFWPLTQGLISTVGWRDTLIVLAAINLFVCVPLHIFFLPPSLIRRPATAQYRDGSRSDPQALTLKSILGTKLFWMLAFAFAANMLAYSCLSVHLIALLHEKGFSMANAVWIGALIGPMQVIGRIGEFTIGSRFRSTQVAFLALAMLPFALIGLNLAGPLWSAAVLCVALCGASNGIMTIARGTMPASIFGAQRYGTVNGALSVPVIVSRALGPLLGSMVWSTFGSYDAVLWMLAAFAVLAVASFHFATGATKHLR
jgi:predicted MFS family arabinose efflux permease